MRLSGNSRRGCLRNGGRETPELGPDGWPSDESLKGANTRFRHAAARWYSCRRPPSRSRRWIAAVGGRVRRPGRDRRLAPERSMWALGVVVVGVDAQDAVELTRAEDQQPVQALRACGPYEAPACALACGERNGVRITSTPSVRKTSSKPATNFESRSRTRNLNPRARRRAEVARLLGDPPAVGIGRRACEVHTTGLRFDEEQHVSGAAAPSRRRRSHTPRRSRPARAGTHARKVPSALAPDQGPRWPARGEPCSARRPDRAC